MKLKYVLGIFTLFMSIGISSCVEHGNGTFGSIINPRASDHTAKSGDLRSSPDDSGLPDSSDTGDLTDGSSPSTPASLPPSNPSSIPSNNDGGTECDDVSDDDDDSTPVTPEEVAENPEHPALDDHENTCEQGGRVGVWVCHLPSNDEEKAHNLCLPLPALRGHLRASHHGQGGHSGDYLGDCQDSGDGGGGEEQPQ